jgi:hypothetical protein
VSVDPVVADRVRKAASILLAGAGSFLLLRVLYRTATGTQRLWDPELLGFVVLATIAVLWVRAAKRVRRGTPPDRPPPV